MIGKDRQIELSLCNPGLSEHIINSPALLLPLLIDEALVGCRPPSWVTDMLTGEEENGQEKENKESN